MRKAVRRKGRGHSERRAADPQRPPTSGAPAGLRWGIPLGIALLTFVCFTPALSADFVNWDDDVNFLRNPHYRGLSLHNLSWMFTHLWGIYIPITWLTLGFDYVLWGMNPAGYHLTSLILHCANAVLFYVLLTALLQLACGPDAAKARWAAAGGALFFAIHPLRVESVAWVTERRDVVCGLFFLFTLLSYLRHHREAKSPSKRRRWFAVSLTCYVLSLLAKPISMTLPLVLLVLDAYPLRRFSSGIQSRSIWLEKIPYVALSLVVAIFVALKTSEAGAILTQYPLVDRVLQPGYRLLFYLTKTAWPVDLSPLYLYRSASSSGIVPYLLANLGALVLFAALIALRHRWPAGLAAWLGFGALLAPVLGWVQAGPHFAADRYTYLACLPWAALVGGALLAALRGAGRISAPARGAAIAAAALVLALLGGATFRQTHVWRDSLSLWNHALEVDPANPIAHYNRGGYFVDIGDLDRALADFDAALRLDPRHTKALTNRGNVHFQQGDLDAALADFSEAIRIAPEHAQAYVNRGNLYAQRGEVERALADFERALRVRTDFADAYDSRGLLLHRQGDVGGALRDFGRALAADPLHAHARLNRANTLRDQGRLEAALRDYNEVIQLDPSRPDAYANRGSVRAAQGDVEGSLADLERALAIAPSNWSHREQVEAALRSMRTGP